MKRAFTVSAKQAVYAISPSTRVYFQLDHSQRSSSTAHCQFPYLKTFLGGLAAICTCI